MILQQICEAVLVIEFFIVNIIMVCQAIHLRFTYKKCIIKPLTLYFHCIYL